MREKASRVVAVGLTFLFSATCLLAVGLGASSSSTVPWPIEGWPTGTPASVGLDEEV